MDKKPYMKLLSILDSRVGEHTNWSEHDSQDGLEFIFSNTKFDPDYLDVDDFISYRLDSLNYKKLHTLSEQYGNIVPESRIVVVEVLFNIIYFSDEDDRFKRKVSSYLARYNIFFSDDLDFKRIISSTNQQCLEGTYGNVYYIDDDFVKKQLKNKYWTDSDISGRFKSEYSTQEKLSQCGAKVLRVFDYDPTMNSFLMERADMDLYELLHKNKLDFQEKIHLVKQLLEVFDIAHNEDIIHRDLHPGNIMIKGKQLYIADFGFAKDSSHLRALLSTFSRKPTHKFIAPEGFKDFKQLDKSSDIFSIGKTIDFILGNGSLGEHHPFRELVNKCTSDEKSERFRDMKSLSETFENSYDQYLREVDFDEINKSISDSLHSQKVEDYLLKLAEDEKIVSQIIANNWFDFAIILRECSEINQLKIIMSIEQSYTKATGYKQLENYDIFARIAYQIVTEFEEFEVRCVSYRILKEIAGIRFLASDLLKNISPKVQNILSENGQG